MWLAIDGVPSRTIHYYAPIYALVGRNFQRSAEWDGFWGSATGTCLSHGIGYAALDTVIGCGMSLPQKSILFTPVPRDHPRRRRPRCTL